MLFVIFNQIIISQITIPKKSKVRIMEVLKFSIKISASPEKVWNVLFTDENYPKWAKVFCEGSKAETSWEKGATVEFIIPDGNGTFAIIQEKVTDQLMVFKHLGVLENGKKMDNEASKQWKDVKESYELIEIKGKTNLVVEMDSIAEYSAHFKEEFPKALKRIKELSE